MARIGIIGALDEELHLYLKHLSQVASITVSGLVFYSGRLAGREVVIVKSGAGKVNAAVCATVLAQRFRVSGIILTGVAGALNPSLNILDIVVSRDSIQHDLDASALGFRRGVVPFTSMRVFKASSRLLGLAFLAAKKLGLRAFSGRVLSGDRFVGDAVSASALVREFKGDCVDMEAGAVAQVCMLNKIPHLVIKSVSDRADHSAHMDFGVFVKKASGNSFLLVRELVTMVLPSKGRVEVVRASIRTVPHWPKKGVLFRDITTLLKNGKAFSHVIDLLAERYFGSGISLVVGIESRGFIPAAVLADRLGVGFVPVRKAGKLPSKTLWEEYELEYGLDRVEVHADAVKRGSRVLLVDDLIATGGTALAACRLLEKLGAKIVECAFIIDLPELGGKKRLKKAGYKTFSLVEFEGE